MSYLDATILAKPLLGLSLKLPPPVSPGSMLKLALDRLRIMNFRSRDAGMGQHFLVGWGHYPSLAKPSPSFSMKIANFLLRITSIQGWLTGGGGLKTFWGRHLLLVTWKFTYIHLHWPKIKPIWRNVHRNCILKEIWPIYLHPSKSSWCSQGQKKIFKDFIIASYFMNSINPISHQPEEEPMSSINPPVNHTTAAESEACVSASIPTPPYQDKVVTVVAGSQDAMSAPVRLLKEISRVFTLRKQRLL